MTSRLARVLSGSAVAAGLLTACAETPPPYQPYAALPAHVSRLALEPVTGSFCNSPYPIGQLRAKVFAADGREYATPLNPPPGQPGPAPGTFLDPAELGGTASFGQFSADLTFVPPVDLLPTLGSNLVVDSWLTKQPNVRARVVIPPRFDCPQYVNLSGRPGPMGSTSRSGGEGEPGPNVRVALGYLTRPGAKPLVIVRVDDPRGLRARTIISPDGPPLQILLDGGNGGMGGMALVHGYGLNRIEIPGGPGGDGGDGGAAEIYYDDAAPELEHKVVVFNRGGPGGGGGGGGSGGAGSGRSGRAGPLPRATPAPARRLFSDELAHGVPIRVQGALEPAANQAI
ncbi:MAG TPA: hypothetical protein VGP64_03020 [Polyangia bacterium]|jgi:hypothetical protein